MATSTTAEHADQPGVPAASNPSATQPSEAVETTGAAADTEVATAPPAPELKLPTRKDASLKDFLNKMDDYAPIVRIDFHAENKSMDIADTQS